MATYGRIQEVAHDIGPHGSLSLSIISADVRLVANVGGRAVVRASFSIGAGSDGEADQIFEAIKLRTLVESASLVVDEVDADRGLGGAISRLFGGRSGELDSVEVEAPAGCRLEVRAVSGDLHASGFRGHQRYQTVSGDVRVVEAAGELDVESVSGDIGLRAVGAVELKVSNVSGDLSAEAPVFDRLAANAVSGDVSVDGALAPGGTFTVDTVSGDLRLASASGMTVAVRGMSSEVVSALPHRTEGPPDRQRVVVGDGAASVTFNSMSGDVAIARSRQSAPPAPSPAPAVSTLSAEERIAILGALERGEIDVDEAMRRLGARS
jgi:hypothetical protein